MTLGSSTDVLAGIREVTEQEVEFFGTNGWAKLDQVLPRELTNELLTLAQTNMGPNGDDPRFNIRGGRYAAWPNTVGSEPRLKAISHSGELGKIASTLVGGRPLRWYTDVFMAKLSADSGGTRTPWHQDYTMQGWDRGGGLTMWIPLVDCPPEKGSLRFLDRSPLAGPLGRFGMRADGRDIVDFYPEILDKFKMSPPLDLKVGDVTVHDVMTVHSAPDNLTASTRWVYAVTYFPAETLYNGAKSNHVTGLEIDQTYPDDRFPIIPV
jgi:hypothetical protein